MIFFFQISTKVKENSINLIFAVTKPQQDLYTRLSSNIQGSFCDVLSEDSSNVVELVKQQYEVSCQIGILKSVAFCIFWMG